MTPDEILETATADFFWLPPDVEVVERDEIKYCYSERPDIEYNRVVRSRPQRADAAALVSEVRRAHEGGMSRWSITTLSDTPELRAALDAADYDEKEAHHVHVLPTDAYDRTVPDEVDVREVASVEDLRRLYSVAEEAFGHAPDVDERDLERELGDCTGEGRRVARFVAYRNGEPAGAADMTFFGDLSFVLLWGAGVRPDHRGHGVYTSLLAARAAYGRERDLGLMGLYAREGTSAPIVAAHGFERHGHMTHYERSLRSRGG